MTEDSRKNEILKVTWIGFFVNLILTAAKFAAGIFGRSGAMVADAVHSLSDFVTDVIVLLFVDISSKPKDETHDYGHGKYETLASVIIGAVLLAVAAGIFLNAFSLVGEFLKGTPIPRPGGIALAAAALSIVGKELLYRYTVSCGKRLDSHAVIANAWHHRSDAFSSIGALIGIAGAYFLGERWIILDPIAALIVSVLIAKTAMDLTLPGLNELLEVSLPKEIEDEILAIMGSFSEIEDPHNLKTRSIGTAFAIEGHVRVAGTMSVKQSHALVSALEDAIRRKFGERTQVIIHVEPRKNK